jgi:hypothetical protein
MAICKLNGIIKKIYDILWFIGDNWPKIYIIMYNRKISHLSDILL